MSETITTTQLLDFLAKAHKVSSDVNVIKMDGGYKITVLANWDGDDYWDEQRTFVTDDGTFVHYIATKSADWQLEQVLEWLNFGWQTDPNLSRDMKQRGGFSKIAIALEKAMRPQNDS